MRDWPFMRLDDIAANEKSAISKPYGSAIVREDYVADGVPVVRGANLGAWRFNDDDFVYITEELADRMPGARLRSGDLVFTHRGSIGQVAMIPRTPRFSRYAVSTSQVKARLDESKALPEFYFYWFRSPVGQGSILEGISTVGVPGLARPVETIKSLRVPVPALAEQRRIVEVLGALDDLIEANRRYREHVRLLTGLAYEQLVRASSRSQKVGDVAGVSDSKTKPGAGRIRYIDIAGLGDGHVELPESISWDEAPSRARMKASAGSTLWSTVRPNRRSHAMLVTAPDDIVVSTGIAVLTPQRIGPAELFAACDRDDFVDQLVSLADGSAYPAVRPAAFGQVDIPLLPADESDRFEALAWPMWQDAQLAGQAIADLSRARDELLPLLMSGRVRVDDIEGAA